MENRTLRFWIIAALLLLTQAFFGSVIILKNGDKIRGKIISQDMKNVRVKTLIGTLTIEKEKIRSIEIERATTEYVIVYLKNKNLIEGWVVDNKPDVIILKTKFGSLSIIKKNIARMQWEKREQTPEKGTEEETKPAGKKPSAGNDPGTGTMKKPSGIKKTENKKSPGKTGKTGKKTVQSKSNPSGKKTIKIKKTAPGKKPAVKRTVHKAGSPKTNFRQFPPDVRLQSMWRSLLLPSWGQFYQGKTAKGAVIAGLAGTGLTGTVISYLKYRAARNVWETTPTRDHHDAVAKWGKRCNVFLVMSLSVWAYNVADVLLFAPSGTPKQSSLAFSPFHVDDSTGVLFHARF